MHYYTINGFLEYIILVNQCHYYYQSQPRFPLILHRQY